MKTPFIIADVGSNYRRYDDAAANKECALEHIRQAAQCGVDAVKFQLFTHRELYGFDGDDTYALPREWVPELAAECEKNRVEFMCTAFSAEGVGFIDPYVKRHKIASAEMAHDGIREAVQNCGKPWIVSTGGATYWEIRRLVERYDDYQLSLLECVAAYPAKSSDYDFHWFKRLSERIPRGISDHTRGDVVAVVAIGMGATIFEKHFDGAGPECWSGRPPSPDSPHSANRFEMLKYVAAIREGFSCLGDGVKRPRESEADFVKYAKREAGMNTFRRKAP